MFFIEEHHFFLSVTSNGKETARFNDFSKLETFLFLKTSALTSGLIFSVILSISETITGIPYDNASKRVIGSISCELDGITKISI